MGVAFGGTGNSGFGCCTTSGSAIYREGRTANKNFKSSLPLVPLENCASGVDSPLAIYDTALT